MSDFARSSVLRRVDAETSEAANIGSWLLRLSQEIMRLDSDIGRILEWIKRGTAGQPFPETGDAAAEISQLDTV